MADPGPIVKTFGMDDVVLKYCKIDGILTVVDCKHFIQQLTKERSEGAVNESAQQVGFADKLLLNKVDACSRELVDETKAAIRGINNLVPIRECSLKDKPDAVPIDELLAIEAFDAAKMLVDQNAKEDVALVVIEDEGHGGGHSGGHGGGHGEGHGGGHGGGHGEGHGGGHGEGHGGGHGGGHGDDDCAGEDCADASHGEGHGAGHGAGHGHGHRHNRHDTDVKSMVLEMKDASLDMRKFQHWLAGVIQERSVDLYRYKGVMAVKHGAKTLLYILQGVHDMPEITFSGEWPEGKPVKTQIVMIGRKLDPTKYRAEFKLCNADV